MWQEFSHQLKHVSHPLFSAWQQRYSNTHMSQYMDRRKDGRLDASLDTREPQFIKHHWKWNMVHEKDAGNLDKKITLDAMHFSSKLSANHGELRDSCLTHKLIG